MNDRVTNTAMPDPLYGGQDPRDVPAYSTWEAARYLRIPLRTVQDWSFGAKTAGREPLIQVADREHHRHQLSFWNVGELHVLDALRTHHQIPAQKLRRLIAYLQESFNTPHPLVNERMLTDRLSVFVDKAGQLINATQAGQLAMRQLLQAHLERIEPGIDGLATRLYPFVRRKPNPALEQTLHHEPRIISLDPRVRFGRPVIAGTSIPTFEIAERFMAGDSVAVLAEDYGRPTDEIQEAIRCEFTFDTAA